MKDLCKASVRLKNEGTMLSSWPILFYLIMYCKKLFPETYERASISWPLWKDLSNTWKQGSEFNTWFKSLRPDFCLTSPKRWLFPGFLNFYHVFTNFPNVNPIFLKLLKSYFIEFFRVFLTSEKLQFMRKNEEIIIKSAFSF